MGDSRNKELKRVNSTWNSYLLAGLIPVGKNKMDAKYYVANADNYVIKERVSFLNLLVSALTVSIYSPKQTIFYVPVEDFKK